MVRDINTANIMFWIFKTKVLELKQSEKFQLKSYCSSPCDLDDIELVENSIFKMKTEPNIWELLS